MSAKVSQITSLTIVYSTVNSGADERKHQSSTSLAFVRGIHRQQVNSPHKGPVSRKCFHLMTSTWFLSDRDPWIEFWGKRPTIYLRAISRWVPKGLLCICNLKMTLLKFLLSLPGAIELINKSGSSMLRIRLWIVKRNPPIYWKFYFMRNMLW